MYLRDFEKAEPLVNEYRRIQWKLDALRARKGDELFYLAVHEHGGLQREIAEKHAFSAVEIKRFYQARLDELAEKLQKAGVSILPPAA